MKNLFLSQRMLFAWICFLFISVSTKAQETSVIQPAGGGAFTVGYGYMDVAKLHEFVPAGITKFRNEHLVIGGTGHAFVDKFVIGGSGFGIVGDVIKTDSVKYSLGGGLGTFDFGYVILNREKIKIYPMIGIGGGGFGIQITKNKTTSVGEVVTNPGREINVSIGGFVFDLSMNINIIPVLNYDEKKKTLGGFMTGLKIGYVYSLPSSNWMCSGGDVTGGPSFGLSMGYVKLIIGGFGYQNKK